MIDHYAFGRMTINGREYTSDLMIQTDGDIQDNWRRRQGHDLAPEDIETLLTAAPLELLVVGTGDNGRMKVSERLLALCRDRGIEIEALPTSAAAQRFNQALGKGAAAAACFHLTC